MRKLKTWEVVLLVIFYPIGICVLIYRIIRKNQLEQKREAAQAAIAIEAQRKAEADREALKKSGASAVGLERELFRVVGVTFDNPDGRNRQEILNKIKFGEPSAALFTLRPYEYKGESAVGVFFMDEQAGSIGRKDLPRILPKMNRFQGVEAYHVVGGFYDETKKDLAAYGLDITAVFKKA